MAAHYRLGDVHRAAGKPLEAMEQYREALEINPAYVYAWNGLGMTLSRGGRSVEALDAFREVTRLYPEEARGYFNLAAQLERMRQDEEAKAAYRKLLCLSASTGELVARERKRATSAIRRLEGTGHQP